MSESTITHSANGVTCTIEMTADEYLVSTEPMLRMAALSKWATFRGRVFAVSAVAFPAGLLCHRNFGAVYRRVRPSMRLFWCRLPAASACVLLYDLRAYFVFCYRLFHRHAIRWRLRRCFGADAL